MWNVECKSGSRNRSRSESRSGIEWKNRFTKFARTISLSDPDFWQSILECVFSLGFWLEIHISSVSVVFSVNSLVLLLSDVQDCFSGFSVQAVPHRWSLKRLRSDSASRISLSESLAEQAWWLTSCAVQSSQCLEPFASFSKWFAASPSEQLTSLF